MAYQYPTNYSQPGQAQLRPQYQQQQAAQQLPHGWEAKYDANYRRYYFINHFTKQTTWNDPRTAPSPNLQHQQAHSSGVPAPPQPMAGPGQAASTPQPRQTPAQVAPKHQENIPLQSMGARNTQHTTETSFSQASSSGKSEQEKLTVKNKIKKDYDLADIILEAALEAADYNEPRVRELLETMGYDPKGGKKGGKKSNAKAATPKGDQERPPRPSSIESPAQVLEDEKPTDFSALYKTQPDTSEEDKASEESVNMSSAASLRSSESTPGAVSRSDVHITVASSSLSGLMHSRGSGAASPMKSADNAHLKSLMQEQPAARKKQHTNKSTAKILLSRDNASKVSVGQANGPDFGLWKGPNPSALQADMIPLRGPDPSLRHGPRREYLSSDRVERIQRCCLAVGPDRSLHSGANASLLISFREISIV